MQRITRVTDATHAASGVGHMGDLMQRMRHPVVS
jgi:hypothetical protein